MEQVCLFYLKTRGDACISRKSKYASNAMQLSSYQDTKTTVSRLYCCGQSTGARGELFTSQATEPPASPVSRATTTVKHAMSLVHLLSQMREAGTEARRSTHKVAEASAMLVLQYTSPSPSSISPCFRMLSSLMLCSSS